MRLESGAAVAPAGSATPTHAPEWIIVGCGDVRLGFALARVSEIVPPPPMTRVPGSTAAALGLASVRGRLVTVLDLGMALELSAGAGGEESRLLLIEQAGRSIGLAVDAVLGIVRAEPSAADATGPGSAPVLGVCHTAGAEFYALDADRLLRQLPLERDEGLQEGRYP
ncbi:MAG: chemotaxis protein CheW [Longimicrobiales bacterium]